MAEIVSVGFGENTGTTAADSSGNSRNITSVPGWTASQSGHGTCMTVNGSGGQVALPALSTYTVMFWFKSRSAPAYSTFLEDLAAAAFWFEFTGTAVDIYWAAGAINYVPGWSFTANTWTHATLTYNGTSSQLYVNGSAFGSPFAGGAPLAATTYTVGGNATDAPGNMELDDFRVFNTALTAAEVTATYATSVEGGGGGSSLTGSRADAVGLTDAATRTVAAVRTTPDPVGVTDNVSASLAGTGSATKADPVGVTDSVSAGLSISRTIADGIAITDLNIPQVLDVALTFDDAEGITDAATRVLAAGRTMPDAVGITDSVSVSLSGVMSSNLTDGVGLTDVVTVALDRAVTVDDIVGLIDAATSSQIGAGNVALPDPVGVGDSVATVGDWLRPTSEPVGLGDTAVALLDRPRTAVDPIGVTDTVVAAITDASTNPLRNITILGVSTRRTRTSITTTTRRRWSST